MSIFFLVMKLIYGDAFQTVGVVGIRHYYCMTIRAPTNTHVDLFLIDCTQKKRRDIYRINKRMCLEKNDTSIFLLHPEKKKTGNITVFK